MAAVLEQSAPPAFGTRFAETMASAWHRDGRWEEPAVGPLEALSLHPATHVLHYSSACFEGLKAYRREDGGVNLFRPDQNFERFNISAARLDMPGVDAE